MKKIKQAFVTLLFSVTLSTFTPVVIAPLTLIVAASLIMSPADVHAQALKLQVIIDTTHSTTGCDHPTQFFIIYQNIDSLTTIDGVRISVHFATGVQFVSSSYPDSSPSPDSVQFLLGSLSYSSPDTIS